MSDNILVTFKDDLTAVVFTINGQPIDARGVLTGLARGTLEIKHSQVEIIPREESLMHRWVKSETWTIVPKKQG